MGEDIGVNTFPSMLIDSMQPFTVLGVQKLRPVLVLNGVLLMKTPIGAAETEVVATDAGTTINDSTRADNNEETRFIPAL